MIRFVCVGLLLTPSFARAEVKFREVSGAATGLNDLMDAWYAAEQQRTGNQTPPWWAWSVTCADLNGDGKPEIIPCLHHGRGWNVFRNKGNDASGTPSFELYPGWNYVAACNGPGTDHPLVIDYAKTGFPSMFSWSGTTSGYKDHLNGSGVFTSRATSMSGAHAAVFEIKDFNSDGKPDVVGYYPGYGKTTERRRINNGDGTFTAQNVSHARPAGLPANVVAELDAFAADTSMVNRFCGPIFWEQDINGDGRLDCLIRYFGGYTDIAHTRGWVLLRNQAGTLEDKTAELGIKGMLYPAFDATGDGRLDLYTSHVPGSGLWVQQGDGSFTNASADLSAFASARQDYPQRFWGVDLDGDGDKDFVVNNSRGKLAEVYEQTAPGTFVKRLRLNVWDAHGIDVVDVNGDGKSDLICGGPGLGAWAPFTPMNDRRITLYLNDSPAPQPVHKIPILPGDAGSPAGQRFLAALSGSTVPYGVTAWQYAQAFRMTNDERYAVTAHALAKAKADAALANIAAGSVPTWGMNSYLDAGRAVQDFCCVLDWCPSFVTEEERLEWMTLCETTCFNIWNYREATWGGRPHPWNGWSVSNPGNNYYFSFLTATVFWGLCAHETVWLDLLRLEKWPTVRGYYASLPAGGSREGTQYGESQRTLFALFRTWKDATGEDLATGLPFMRGSADYWAAAVQPGDEYLSPIGDLARDVSARFGDYNRHLFLELARNNDSVARGRLAWVNTFRPRMMQPMNLVYDLLEASTAEVLPPPLAYAAPEVGDYWWTSGHDVDARAVYFRAGLWKEAHAQADNGSIQFWGRRKRLITTANVWSRDGLRGNRPKGPPYLSVVRFEKDGVLVEPKYGVEPSAKAWAATDDHMSASATFSPFYAAEGIQWTRRVEAWKRTAEHTEGYLTVEDDCTLPDGVTAHVQFQLSDEPVVVSERQVMAGPLLIESADPVTWTVLDWRTVTSPTSFAQGWRLSATGASQFKFKVTLQ